MLDLTRTQLETALDADLSASHCLQWSSLHAGNERIFVATTRLSVETGHALPLQAVLLTGTVHEATVSSLHYRLMGSQRV
jgi:hypothetical protein